MIVISNFHNLCIVPIISKNDKIFRIERQRERERERNTAKRKTTKTGPATLCPAKVAPFIQKREKETDRQRRRETDREN